MAYAVKQDIDDRYDDIIYPMIPDPDDPDQEIIDENSVNNALSDAAAEIDLYLCVKHNMPLTQTPPLLVRLSVDIALYRMTRDAVGNSEERRQRYEDAVKTLERIAAGAMALGIEETEETPSGGVVIEGPGRLFSRKTMGGIL